MIRVAILLAISLAQGTCSPGKVSGNSAAEGVESIAAIRSEAGAPALQPDRGTGSSMSNTPIMIITDQGGVRAELVDNEATRALVRMVFHRSTIPRDVQLSAGARFGVYRNNDRRRAR